MDAKEMVERLGAFANRGAGTDAERRAARALSDELASGGRDVLLETFWCRPNWAVAHAWHVALAVAGSLVSLASPVAAAAMLGVALLSVIVDALTGCSPGRRLTAEHASQNVVAVPPTKRANSSPRVHLILTANYDAARAGVAYRNPFRRTSSSLRRTVRGITPGWIGWLSVAISWLLAIAILRLEGHKSQAIGAVQLPPTVALVLGFALLLDLAGAGWSPGAGDNGSGVAVALALARALDAAPPRHLDVEVVLTGAGDGDQIGLRRYLRARRRERRPANTVVVGVAPCGGGNPRWWTSDGALLPLRYARPLRDLAREIAAQEPHLHAQPHQGRGRGAALPARMARLPALAIGCLDHRGLAPRSHQSSDFAAAIDGRALDGAVQFGLLLVDAVDATVGEGLVRPSPTPA